MGGVFNPEATGHPLSRDVKDVVKVAVPDAGVAISEPLVHAAQFGVPSLVEHAVVGNAKAGIGCKAGQRAGQVLAIDRSKVALDQGLQGGCVQVVIHGAISRGVSGF